MADFIFGTELSSFLEDMIYDADKYLILVSPYIKLHGRIKNQLKKKK